MTNDIDSYSYSSQAKYQSYVSSRHRDIRSYDFTSVDDVCNLTLRLVHRTDSWTRDSEINGRTYVLPKWSLTPILSSAPPAERSNESMSVERNAPPSPCYRGHITRQLLKPAWHTDGGIDCIGERLSGSVFAEPQYLRFDSRPTETNLCTFGRNRNLAETQISVTAVTVTRSKLKISVTAVTVTRPKPIFQLRP